ncbi:hypothetical protein BCR41DRAFT_372647 [Lobosporangium transversale]|uniref:Uncharacterized protein n=1 Tax=Lobosporangium transversale TaxID=64571 RepID=A0A1Y2GKF9_9FUNG|nr:hypothetical protein BCR41DRAFT_372647 [Lobosporangium transversale]ORZ10052.1 hypothetical protein BCR41DRAFT_372647 [Lobosporangium transversale]|eukprot:XP_021879142.1 hypothetical protein BCR41DRAFT_372647 [Lobosporangium transversale]
MAPDVVTRGNSTLAMFKRLMPTIESLIIDATTGPNQADSANYDRLWTLRLNSKEMRQVDELIGVLELINEFDLAVELIIITDGYLVATTFHPSFNTLWFLEDQAGAKKSKKKLRKSTIRSATGLQSGVRSIHTFAGTGR